MADIVVTGEKPGDITATGSGRCRPWSTPVMVLLVLTGGLYQIAFTNRITNSDSDGFPGNGGDAALYGRMAQGLRQVVFREGLDDERVHRIVPSAVVYMALRGLGVERTKEHVIAIFLAYNLILLAAGAAVYGAVADRLVLGPAARWIGFLALFVNYGTARVPFYCPVTTDTTAFTLGLLMFYLHLKGSRFALAGLVIVGSFAWTTLVYWGVLLLTFPRPAPLRGGDCGRASGVLGLVAAVVYAVLVVARTWVHHPVPYWTSLSEIVYPVLPLSLLLAAAYLFRGTQLVFDVSLAGVWRAAHLGVAAAGPLLTATALAVVWAVGHALSVRPSQGMLYFLVTGDYLSLLTRSIVKPLIFTVAHFAYFGPVVLLMVLYWRSVCRVCHELGLGMTLFAAATVGFSLTSESRHLTHAFPALAILTVRAIERLRPGRAFCLLFSVVSVFRSQAPLWLLHRVESWADIEGDRWTGLPKALYGDYWYGSMGPWMRPLPYLQTIATALVFGFLMFQLLPGCASEGQREAIVRPRSRRLGVRLARATAVAKIETTDIQIN